LLYEALLAVADVAVAGAGALGYALLKRVRPADISNVPQAFGALERAIEVSMAGLPEGFTWKETFERLREEGIRADWARMKEILASYEAYRYGGKETTAAGKDEVVKLAMNIRGGIFGRRTKR
jgi:hypothetical protein